jgi:molybdate transport system substrate-binding protein
MTIRPLAAAARIALVLLLGRGVSAQAAEIKVLAGAFVRPVLEELGAQFERTTGHKLAIKWVPGPAVGREVEAGEAFDVAISQADTIDHLVKAGKIDPATRAEVIRVGLGVAVRAGAPKPDIGSVEAFKRALLNAKSVATSPQSASGAYLAGLLERLGIAAEVKPKLKSPPVNTGGAFGAVARGEAEIGFSAAAIIPGTELVPIPAELQLYQVFVAGVGTDAKETDAAKALVKFLTSEAAVPVIRAKGMEPGK